MLKYMLSLRTSPQTGVAISFDFGDSHASVRTGSE